MERVKDGEEVGVGKVDGQGKGRGRVRKVDREVGGQGGGK